MREGGSDWGVRGGEGGDAPSRKSHPVLSAFLKIHTKSRITGDVSPAMVLSRSSVRDTGWRGVHGGPRRLGGDWVGASRGLAETRSEQLFARINGSLSVQPLSTVLGGCRVVGREATQHCTCSVVGRGARDVVFFWLWVVEFGRGWWVGRRGFVL